MLWALALVGAEVCLLTLKKPERTALAASFAAWAKQHRKLRSDVDSSANDFDQFIADQRASSDACHPKLLEARRTVDGLHAKIAVLSNAAQASEAIVAAHTQMVQEKDADKQVEAEKEAGTLAECNKNKEQETERVKVFETELAELTSFGNPEVTSGALVATKATLSSTEAKTACQAAARALRVANESATSNVYYQVDCSGQRDVLQQEFTKSVVEIRSLRDQEAALVAVRFTECTQAARSALVEARARLDESITASTAAMNVAADRVTALDPLLAEAKNSLAKVSTYVEDLRANCAIQDYASEHLERIRDLIESLEKCPGRHDFDLTTPTALSGA